MYIVSEKAGPPKSVTVTSSNLSRFFKILSLLDSLYKFSTKCLQVFHHTLSMLLHYLGKLKRRICPKLCCVVIKATKLIVVLVVMFLT